MNYTVITYSLYLVIALSVTIWVARTLHTMLQKHSIA